MTDHSTKHPCAGMSLVAREIFEAIAINQTPPYRRTVVSALLKRGLIRQIGERTLGRDTFGAINVSVYEVPLGVHMQWCQWASENCDGSL